MKFTNMLQSKRGSLMDAIYVPIFIMIVIMTAFIGLYVYMQFQSNFTSVVANSVGNGITAEQNTTLQNVMTDIRGSLNLMDSMMPIIVAGLLIVSLIFAFRTGASIVYAVVSLILWGFALMLSVIYTNMFEQFASFFPAQAAAFPIMVYIMANMRYIVLFWLFLTGIVMLTRNKQEEQSISASEMVYQR